MKSVIGPIALTGAWLVVAIPGCIESSCEEKRTCGGSPAPTESGAGSGGELTLLPRATGGRASGTGFGLGGGPPATGGASSQGGSAGSEAEPAAIGGETAAGEAGAGGETAAGRAGAGGVPSVSDAGAAGTEPTSQAEAGSGGQAGTDAGAGGTAGQTDQGEAGNSGAPTTEGCDPESRVRRELLADGRFEPSTTGWSILNGALLQTSGNAQSAPNFVQLGAFNEAETFATQLVTFPPEAADIKFTFYVRIESINTAGNDFMYFGFTRNETELDAYPLEQESIPEWTYVETDLPATYAGQVKELIFAGLTDSEPGYKTFFIDTVSLTALVCP
jgi:hypothetical protein